MAMLGIQEIIVILIILGLLLIPAVIAVVVVQGFGVAFSSDQPALCRKRTFIEHRQHAPRMIQHRRDIGP